MPDELPVIWTEEQVLSLNDYQRCGMWHPFTCGNSHDGDRDLVATPTGLKCPGCAYTQYWAHGFMLDRSWEKQLDASPMHKAIWDAIKNARETV